MQATAAQKVKIGVFTMVGVGLLFAAIFVIGSNKNIFSKTFSIYGTFKNISGLQIGNNVRFAGINVGTVISIDIENDTTIRVGMRLKDHVHRFLKDDATASIGTDGLMGDKLVNISPGHEDHRLLASDGQIRTVNPIEFDKIISRISHVADNADAITTSLANISGQVSSGKGSIGRLIYSDSLEKGLEGTVKSAHAAINSVHTTVSKAQQTIQTAQQGAEGFKENMDAMKHSFLLKHYYKKQAKKQAKEKEDKEK
jgi:phospholipid/cholesterol/gamma-HCH transport system substrate-binding protein